MEPLSDFKSAAQCLAKYCDECLLYIVIYKGPESVFIFVIEGNNLTLLCVQNTIAFKYFYVVLRAAFELFLFSSQVFSVPVEERRYKEMTEQQFGEKGREQAKICNDIMASTGNNCLPRLGLL